MSKPKEPHFLCRRSLQIGGFITEKQYMSIFAKANNHKIIAEASTATIYDEEAIVRVRGFAPQARIIAILRNPVDQAPSWHSECVRLLREDIADFGAAWAAISERRAGRRVPEECPDPLMLDYAYIASFGTQLERVYAQFPARQVYVAFLDDFVAEPRVAWLRLLAFLDIPDDGRTEFPPENVGYVPANLPLYRGIRKATRAIKRALRLKVETGVIEKITWSLRRRDGGASVAAAMLGELHAVLDPEIVKLERITGRDLSHWRRTSR
jgi:hypothetical protein